MRSLLFFILISVLFSCSQVDYGSEEILRLEIPEESSKQLQIWASQALKQGVITNDLKKYVPAKIRIDSATFDAKIRLKGDWTDHLKGGQWSLRIKLLHGTQYRGYSTFSIMEPSTRNFMDEWFLHKVMEDQNVLTTRFDYTPVEINGEDMGVYAIEEHFTEDLIVHNLRTLGPILKISEDGIWEVITREKETKRTLLDSLPIFEASVISPFEKKKVLKSKFLKEGFERGQNLLYAYMSGLVQIDSIIKVKPLAKMYAVGDLGKILHGLDAHNQRWHYDFASDRLEAIAYDLVGNKRLEDSQRKPLYGLKSDHSLDINKRKDIVPYLPYNSNDFLTSYIHALSDITRKAYLDSILTELDPQIERCEKLIQMDKPDYAFETDFYYHNAYRIKDELKRFEEPKQWPNPRFHLGPWHAYADTTIAEPFEHVSLNAYWDRSDSVLFLENFYADPVAIVGYSIDNLRHKIDTLTLHSFNPDLRPLATIKFPPVDELYFVTSIQGAEFKTEVYPWRHPAQPKSHNLQVK